MSGGIDASVQWGHAAGSKLLGEFCQRSPAGINEHFIFGRDKGQSGEKSVAKPIGVLLHRIADGGFRQFPAEILHDVGLARRHHKADARRTSSKHAVNQVLADRFRTLLVCVHP